MKSYDNRIRENQDISEDLSKKTALISAATQEIVKIIEDDSLMTTEIVVKLKSVDSIANKTNLLAINASIETIHASSLLGSFEEIVAQNMLIQAKLTAKVLEFSGSFKNDDCIGFAQSCGIEEIFVTNKEGIITHTNMSGWKDMKLTSSDIYKILGDPNKDIVLPAVSRGQEGVAFKAVGIARTDEPGIIQLGCQYDMPEGQMAIDGFGVVAREAKRLADEAKETSVAIRGLINGMKEKIEDLARQSLEIDRVSKRALSDDGRELTSSIESIKDKVMEFEQGIMDMGHCYKGIQGPLSQILKIAKQTNLLGVRASIEAAHSTNDKMDFDLLLNKHMLIQVKITAMLLDLKPEMDCDHIMELANYAGVDEFWISDGNGVVELTNIVGGKGFAYKNEGQTAPYMKLLVDPSLIVMAPPERRVLDGKVFKYVAVGRKTKRGFIQVGKASKMYGESTAEGFAVVSKQIKSLAEQSKDITSEMMDLLELLNLKADEAKEILKNCKKYLQEATMLIKSIHQASE